MTLELGCNPIDDPPRSPPEWRALGARWRRLRDKCRASAAQWRIDDRTGILAGPLVLAPT